jgi:dTDP-4-dehydrorhamnose reductase
MKIVITGASGLYGSRLAQIAEHRHNVYSVYNMHLARHGTPIKLDVSDKASVENAIQRMKPDAIVHAATLTNVDQCELDRKLARKINVDGTFNVANAAQKNGVFLLYISTDYVFDGEKGNYKETDQPSPINFYGYTKLKAEEIVENSTTQFCIARTSVIYGATPAAGKNNFALWLVNKLNSREQTRIVVDQWNSPTLNTNFAQMTLELIERKLTGLFHLSGATRISRYDFAVSLATTIGADSSLISPIPSADFQQIAKRPRDSSLNVTKAHQILKNKPMNIAAALENLKIELSKLDS